MPPKCEKCGNYHGGKFDCVSAAAAMSESPVPSKEQREAATELRRLFFRRFGGPEIAMSFADDACAKWLATREAALTERVLQAVRDEYTKELYSDDDDTCWDWHVKDYMAALERCVARVRSRLVSGGG